MKKSWATSLRRMERFRPRLGGHHPGVFFTTSRPPRRMVMAPDNTANDQNNSQVAMRSTKNSSAENVATDRIASGTDRTVPSVIRLVSNDAPSINDRKSRRYPPP